MKILVLGFIVLILFSCKKDTTNIDSPLIGKWEVYTDFSTVNRGIVLKSNGRVYGYENNLPSVWFKYKSYSVLNDSLAVFEGLSGEKETFQYAVSGDNLYLGHCANYYSCGGRQFFRRN